MQDKRGETQQNKVENKTVCEIVSSQSDGLRHVMRLAVIGLCFACTKYRLQFYITLESKL